MQAAITPSRRRADAPPWPFAPLTEAQEASRRAQECAMRRDAARVQHQRLQHARAALAATLCITLAACGGGGDEEPEAPQARTPTPAVHCPASAPSPCI